MSRNKPSEKLEIFMQQKIRKSVMSMNHKCTNKNCGRADQIQLVSYIADPIVVCCRHCGTNFTIKLGDIK